MSKNVAIKEGGNAYSFGQVDYLRVESSNGQYAPWVPESERQLSTKSIDKNGIYPALVDGVYGWSSVSVNVQTQDGVTGEGDDGEQHYVSPDPETGELVDEVLPTSIEITIPPTKLTYADGETIDLTGAVVKAYYESGGEWGTVPNGEITLNPAVARFDPASMFPETASSDLDTGVDQPIPCGPCESVVERTYSNIKDTRTHRVSGTGVFANVSSSDATRIVAGENSGVLASTLHEKRLDYPDHTEITTTEDTISSSNSYTYDGKTVYYNNTLVGWSGFSLKSISPVATGNASGKGGQIAWTIIYGTKTPAHSYQTITVSWQRPGDGAVLETSFNITITTQQGYGGATGGGGQAGETGAGRND